MDSNSTISVGVSFFTAHGGSLLGIAQLVTAIVLATFTFKLYQATAKYASLVREQNQMMDKNRTHDFQVKKYNRMLDEMKYLIAPLYTSRRNPNIFAPIKIISNVGTVDGKIHRPSYENYIFWENIEKNIYLNQSIELKDCIDKYLNSLTIKSDPQKMQPIIDELVNAIEHRYLELSKQVQEIENDLNIIGYSKQASNPEYVDE